MKFQPAATTLLACGIASCCGAGAGSAQVDAGDRRLVYEPIWRYEPKTKVTDIAAIDQDLHAITRELRKQNFETGERIYREGGHSGSFARLVLSGDGLGMGMSAGTQVVGPSLRNGEDGARGYLMDDSSAGEKVLRVAYDVSAVQENHVGCQIGALTDTITNRCFAETGDLTFPDFQQSYNYSYDPQTDNDNTRTLFDLNLQSKKWSDTKTFFKFMEYYGTDEYLDEIISSAFDFRETNDLFRGNMDFSIYREKGNKEIVEFAIPVMTMFITVLGSMEDALLQCNRGCMGDVCRETPGMFEWDSAVAYYTGSRLDLPNDKGDFLFAFADERCTEFRTCGEDAKSAVGFAKVNHDLFKLFNQGQEEITQRNCKALRETKNSIEGLMIVPLVQGTLRYAHMVMGEMITGEIEKHNAEASVFALSVLPLVHHCNPLDAEIIHQHLKPKETTDVDYQVVKHAFEKNYACMNIKCNEVGGIYDVHNGTYRWDAPPCVGIEVELSKSEQKWAVGLGVVLLLVVALAVVVCCVRKCGKGKESSGSDFTPNIEAELA